MVIQTELVKSVLNGLKRGDCWCEMAVGNPMVSSHDKDCLRAQALTLMLEEESHVYYQKS